MARVDRKQRVFEHREEDILDGALALLSHPNWESVTIEQIANEAEIGKGTVYKHFASKDELLFRLMMRFYSGLLLHLQDAVVEADDILAGFRRIFEFAFRYHLERKEYRYIVEYCNRIDFKERADESWHASFLELDKAFGEWGDPLLLSAMDRGQIENRPLGQISIGMHACFNGAVDMLWAGKDWCAHGDEEQIIESVTEFMMAGLVGRV
ncbi:MAG: TetR/AcrR family transcriptional regulator [Candidatus Thiodiazotropha sp. (ex Semelilucina semeliformis)]|nr:TetR/AcrR family transcriptional regulator [Candidatus Thiodiazotropha sp. (ex Semelilucina semeliformis)]